ncbi:GbsR/MarR family transcriptional regulator [Chondrinema litorale]|uniref:GbsR/MarR family transcriptional regulator n=1 Tax=Chondrinema litorale TaxID=2994555 RepID=UPI002542E985|nr:transcriptional regulator [Chondrinema litorale]UZR94854.1 transcriptional regulator [Chondrinema litorale]
MELDKAKMEFVQTWGALGSSWGIPRSMAQIHALLLSNKNELSTEEIMEAIQLSRGNVNINLRELINWKLVSKQNKLGERKEFFAASHNIWEISKNIMQERKRRELQPVQDLLISLKNESLEGDDEEVLHFKEMVKSLDEFISQMDQLSELMIRLNDNMFFKKVIQMFQNN